MWWNEVRVLQDTTNTSGELIVSSWDFSEALLTPLGSERVLDDEIIELLSVTWDYAAGDICSVSNHQNGMVDWPYITWLRLIDYSTLIIFENVWRGLDWGYYWAMLESIFHLQWVIWLQLNKITNLMVFLLSIFAVKSIQVTAFIFGALEWVRLLLENWC